MRAHALARWPAAAVAAWLAVATPVPVAADEAAIRVALRTAFAEPARVAELAATIAADPAYRPERLSDWLHETAPVADLAPGRHALGVDVGHGQTRDVTLRVPKGYAGASRWPLLYALHPSGGSGPRFVDWLEGLLGDEVERFLVAAPSGYRQTGLDAPAPFTRDHPAILRAVRATARVDADRVVVVGYSLGGYAAWAVATLHADLVAAAVPLASTFTQPLADDGLWRELLGNWRALRVLHVWGARDDHPVYGVAGEPLGGVAERNRRFVAATRGLDLPVTAVELPGRGHGDVVPPHGPLLDALHARRAHAPRRVDHAFRHLHQGSAYWLEAVTWQGDAWGETPPPVEPRPGETFTAALGRTLATRLARLTGEKDGATLRITTRHVGALTVLLYDDLVTWGEPLRVVRDGVLVYEGSPTRDLAICLTRAIATRDLDRLAWARIDLPAPG